MPQVDEAMPGKLIIIQNELKDQRGHYLETALAVAEAAPRFDLTPYILGHATCDPGIIPAGVAFLPICRLDHQMHYPPVPALKLGPFQVSPQCDLSPVALRTNRIHKIVKSVVPPLIGQVARGLRSRGQPILPPDALDIAGCGHERHFIEEWRKDLAFTLTLLQVDARDHVLFLTAHARELHAVRRIVDELPGDRRPTFHLEFRHSLEFTEPDRKPLNSFTATHLALFDSYRPFGSHPSIRLYTDTAELSELYSRASQLAHFTLPIPFRNGKLVPHERHTGDLLRVTYLGDPRDEKGFHRLPELVETLAGEPVRFVIQASLVDLVNNPKSTPALSRLQESDSRRVELAGLNGPLTPDDYFRLVSAADVLIFPFDREAYQRRSSGTLTEAIAAGVPTVVPDDTWLSRQQPPGSGERFTDDLSLAEAVRRMVRRYDEYEGRAAEARAGWLSKHTPDNVVRSLLSGDGPRKDDGTQEAGRWA